MAADNHFTRRLQEHAKVVRAGPYGKFEHTLQGPRQPLITGQIYDGANAVDQHPDHVPESGQGWNFSTFEFFMTITDDAGHGQLVDTDFTSIASQQTLNPSIIAVEAAGPTPTGIAHWEAQSVDPSSDTISIPAVPSDPLTDVVEMKFTVTGTALKLVVRNLNSREWVIRPPTPQHPWYFDYDKIDYAIRALYFNSPYGVKMSLDSVRAEISYTSSQVSYPYWRDMSGSWNLVSAL